MVAQVSGPGTAAATVVAPVVESTPGVTVHSTAPVVAATIAAEVARVPAPLWPEVEDTDVTGPPPVIAGPPGPARSYQHVQGVPAATWMVQHDLGIFVTPTLRLSDAPEEPVFADVRFLDDNNVMIEWPEPVAGWADF